MSSRQRPTGGVSPIARKGGECPSFSSSYEEHFKYRCFSPPPTEKKFPCSVIMGDKSILERETTHSAAFGHKGAPSPVSQKERLPVSGGDDRGHKWTTTTSDTFPAHKAEPNRVKVTNKTLSSFSQGHTDNQMRMTTTNTHVLSEEKHKQIPVRVSRTKTKTRSDVPLGQPGMEGMFYSTTYKDIYDHKQQSPAQNRFPSGRYLKDQALEVIPALSRVQMDYTPLKGRRNDLTPEQLQQEKHKQIPVRVSRANTKTRSDVPLGQPGMEGMFYSTTYKDIYDHKQQSPAQNRFPSGRYLKDQALEAIPALSRVQMDYTPLKGRRNDLTPEQLQQEKHNQIPVRVSRANTMTRSDVPLEQPGMEGMFYSTTTSRENYDHKQQRPAQPCHFPSGIYMKDQALEAIPALSRVQMDYTPLKGRRNDLTPEQLQQVKASHISFPYDGHCFTTTHGETYGPKPYSRITFRRSSKISNIPF
ncbi:uncharacterized protein si:dkey-13m1.5 isoform X2 [Hoplias malabaricus]|uniref:uncharacterized protein si:dkey-13m1.5 isoform X2 n=1 Tax=Hoplias malabaricus TaxID=27720 RepID=UPI0034625313